MGVRAGIRHGWTQEPSHHDPQAEAPLVAGSQCPVSWGKIDSPSEGRGTGRGHTPLALAYVGFTLLTLVLEEIKMPPKHIMHVLCG